MSLALVLILVAALAFAGFHFFEPARKGNRASESSKLPGQGRAVFLTCLFSLFSKLSAADGEVSSHERERIEEIMSFDLEMNEKERRLAWKIFEGAQSNPLTVREYAERFRSEYPDQVRMHDQVVEALLKLSIADGFIHEEEEDAIHTVALLLGLSEPGYKLLRRNVLKESGASVQHLQ